MNFYHKSGGRKLVQLLEEIRKGLDVVPKADSLVRSAKEDARGLCSCGLQAQKPPHPIDRVFGKSSKVY